MRETEVDQDRLLAWYDANARDLAWRIPPEASKTGVLPDPYRVWLSEIMLQQTTVAAVKSYFQTFTRRWPTVADLAAADDADVLAAWAGLGYYARARNLLKCARRIAGDMGGRFPENQAELEKLPGIGPYTSAAIAAIAFQQPETVVDGNVERVVARLFGVQTPLPKAKTELRALASRLTPRKRAGDFAQAMMDLGATVCTVRAPGCAGCPLGEACQARAGGFASSLPRRDKPAAKPVRLGYAYVAIREDGALLLERRPEHGLLGGMLGWPGSDWSEAPLDAPPLKADWRDLPGEVRHTFTHFHLRLRIRVARVATSAAPERGKFVLRHDFRPSDMPTVMRKVHDLASSFLDKV